MIELKELESKLSEVGFANRFWAEVHELRRTLMPDENIIGAVSGRYTGGFALLIATDRRVLLIDKKLITLSMEDVRYEMIAEVDYFAHLFEATITVVTLSKSLKFTSIKQSNLRELTSFVQQQVMQLRHGSNFEQAMRLPNTQDPSNSYLVPNSKEHTVQGQVPAIHSFHKPQGLYPGTALTMRRRVSRFYPSS
jgi:hypothetical protein